MAERLMELLMKYSILIKSKKTMHLVEENLFFGRIEFDSQEIKNNIGLQKELEEFKRRHFKQATFDLHKASRKNMALFVSNQGHCLKKILEDWFSGDLKCNIPIVISNHSTYKELVESYGIEFYCLKQTKFESDDRNILQLLESRNIDFIALARYMQILSPNFVKHYNNNIINIHHSLLPAFIGANTYQRAFERGVKIVGSTAHYVTEALDQGPIITQEATQIEESMNLNELKAYVRNTEMKALLKAINLHIEERIFVHKNKTHIIQ